MSIGVSANPLSVAKAFVNTPVNVHPSIPPIPTSPVYSVVKYTGSAHDPFVSFYDSKMRADAKNGVVLASTSNKNLSALPPLLRYKISSMRLSGFILWKGEDIALIVTPNGNVYRARKGTKIGMSHGAVINVNPDSEKVEVKRYVPDGFGKFKEETTTMVVSKP